MHKAVFPSSGIFSGLSGLKRPPNSNYLYRPVLSGVIIVIILFLISPLFSSFYRGYALAQQWLRRAKTNGRQDDNRPQLDNYSVQLLHYSRLMTSPSLYLGLSDCRLNKLSGFTTYPPEDNSISHIYI